MAKQFFIEPQNGYTIQIGDSKLLLKITNTTVVSNFRENDILNGGQGAPLAPIYHQLILSRIKSKHPSACDQYWRYLKYHLY